MFSNILFFGAFDKEILVTILYIHQLGDYLNSVEVQDIELKLFDFQNLASATNNFHEFNKHGKGGFGPVYIEMVALLEFLV